MFDRNTVLAMFLVMCIMIGYTWYIQPTPQEAAEIKRKADSTALAEKQSQPSENQIEDTIVANTAAAAPIDTNASSGLFKILPSTATEDITLQNEKISCQISTLGARPHDIQIAGFKGVDSNVVSLFTHKKDKYDLSFKVKDSLNNAQMINTSQLVFETIQKTKTSCLLRAYTDQSKTQYVEYNYTLAPNSYLLDWKVKLVNLQNVISNDGFLTLNLETHLKPQELNHTVENTYTTVYYKDQEVDYLSETKSDDAKLTNPEWISFKQQFFNTTLIASKPFSGLEISQVQEKENPDLLKTMKAQLVLNYEPKSEVQYDMKWFLGPNEYNTLKSEGVDLQTILPYGWKIFRTINEWAIRPLFNFIHRYVGSYGIVILILTILIKLLVFPLTFKSYVASAKMKLLKPEIDKLKIKYKDDAQKLQMEQMKLQNKSGVSILGGCMPQLLQMPLWIALYRFFPATIDLRHARFLWANDLSDFDSILTFGGYHISLFCLLFCLSQLLMTWYMSRTTEIPDQMKYMQYFFPIMMFFFLNSTSAALNWYLFAGNIVSMILQFLSLKYLINHDKLSAQMEENRKKPQKKSGFQQRLEEAMKQQEQSRKKK